MTTVILDHTVLAELGETVGGDFVDELVATFLEEGPGMLDELRKGAASGNVEAVRRAAHSLKSNAKTFGAVALAEAARRVEVEGVGDENDGRIEAISQAFDAAARALSDR
ncbi:MAG: Hpt domain-containing protein [Roseobacter sp.]|jgi:HPt (histidine-containing phosphotransfer) domain-containing protein|nr:Hpt domain-containing protein [Roseobacter sp.]